MHSSWQWRIFFLVWKQSSKLSVHYSDPTLPPPRVGFSPKLPNWVSFPFQLLQYYFFCFVFFPLVSQGEIFTMRLWGCAGEQTAKANIGSLKKATKHKKKGEKESGLRLCFVLRVFVRLRRTSISTSLFSLGRCPLSPSLSVLFFFSLRQSRTSNENEWLVRTQCFCPNWPCPCDYTLTHGNGDAVGRLLIWLSFAAGFHLVNSP